MEYDDRIKDATREIVLLLAALDYSTIEESTKGVRLSANEIQYAIEEYGRTIIMPPISVFEELDVIEVTGAKPREWSVRCPLWTEEEGRSDLTLELSLVETPDGNLRIEMDNVIVL